jgi:hypothetical protein
VYAVRFWTEEEGSRDREVLRGARIMTLVDDDGHLRGYCKFEVEPDGLDEYRNKFREILKADGRDESRGI